MKQIYKGVVLAAIHLLLVGSLGAKLIIDRARLPRVWVKTAPRDPNLPIRGRYVDLALEVRAVPPFVAKARDTYDGVSWRSVPLEIQNGELLALSDRDGANQVQFNVKDPERARLWSGVAYFIPEHAQDPSIRPQGEELWVEVSVPRKGPPRPIRLGIRKGGQLQPLDLR
jgi:hypothetical protein